MPSSALPSSKSPMQMSELSWLYRFAHNSRVALHNPEASLAKKIGICVALALTASLLCLSLIGIIPVIRTYTYWRADERVEKLIADPIFSKGNEFPVGPGTDDDGFFIQPAKATFCALQRLKIENKIYAWGHSTRTGSQAHVMIHPEDVQGFVPDVTFYGPQGESLLRRNGSKAYLYEKGGLPSESGAAKSLSTGQSPFYG